MGTMRNVSSIVLKKNDFFTSLSDGALEALANVVQSVELPEGTVIIKEGEHGDAFYLICEGSVEVTKMNEYGQSAKLSILGAGEIFGEMALMTGHPRSSTVTAITDVTLGKINREDFEEIRRLDRAFSRILERRSRDYADFNRIKILQPVALLEPEKMSLLISSMDEKRFAPGETIIHQGEKGDAYYIIKSGRVAVIKKKEGREPEQVAEMKSGSGFGEEALIREEPRSATIRAVDETIVLTINKQAFVEVMQKTFIENAFPEDLDAEERERVIFIDARITPEYAEEHIAGAVNVPIEILRDKYEELDRSGEYYTYCTNDSRGMTAAFLMKSMGFHVKALRGGLSAWDGETVGLSLRV
jgi:CRP-like cAMP-binding protein